MAAVDNNPAWQQGDQLESAVARHVAKGSTGTLFVRTPDNHWGCFVFDDGDIVSVMYRGIRGWRSLAYLRHISQCTCKFDGDARLGEDSGDLPDTAEILSQLGDSSGATHQQRPIALSAVELKSLVRELAMAVLGPIGELVCDEQFARAGILSGIDDLDKVLRGIGYEMDDPEDARDFRERVMRTAASLSNSGQRVAVTDDRLEYERLSAILNEEAANFLGPLGPQLCSEYLHLHRRPSGTVDIGLVVRSLAAEIDDPGQSEQFRQRLTARLDGVD